MAEVVEVAGRQCGDGGLMSLIDLVVLVFLLLYSFPYMLDFL